jgi:uncharacterized membrane protein YjgN (DUF898 family)
VSDWQHAHGGGMRNGGKMQQESVASVPSIPLVATQGVSPAAVGSQRVLASGTGLAGLVWRGLFLTIITLGIYRFWYRTDLRRWYWRNTSIGGDGFAYHGTPKELFIGFLIALAVTLPLYFAGTLAALFIASETTSNIVTVAGLALLGVLAQYGAFRARRFRMTRTAWRGVRFDQEGSAWRYARVSTLWGLATLATLGLTLPLFRRSLEAMKIANTRFGSARGAFEAAIGGLMLRWIPAWLLLIAALAGLAWAVITASFSSEGSFEEAAALATVAITAVVGFLVFFIAWPIYRAAEFRVFTAGSTLGPLTFSSDLRARSLFGMYLVFALVLIGLGLLALFVGLFTLGAAIAVLSGRGGNPGFGIIALAAALYLGGVYVFMALKELLLNRAFWRRAAGSVTVSGLEHIGDITGSAVAADNAAGEGLADALDFGGV